jgi:hypothetical protein
VDNRAPAITTYPSNPTNQYRSTYWEFQYIASDPDTDGLTWQKGGNATFLTVSGTGLLYGTTAALPSWYTVTVWANDSYGGSSYKTFQLNILNRNPSISSSGNTSQKVTTYMAYDIIASDPDSDGLSYQYGGNASGFLAISGHWLNGTCGIVGWYECTVWANDSYGGNTYQHWHLTVGPNQAPYFTNSGNATQRYLTFVSYHAEAYDSDLDPIGYEYQGNASFLSFSNQWLNGSATELGWFECTIWANDTFGGSGQQHWHLMVTPNQPPYFTSTPIYTKMNQTTYSYDANAVDPETDPLTYDLEGNSTAFLTIDPSTGIVSGLCVLEGWYYANISVTDGGPAGQTVWQNITLTITEYVDPVIPTGPSQISLGVVLLAGLLCLAMFIAWRNA